MTVQERTEGGYTKVETKNGVIRYHDPNGHPTNQQAFAGSKQQEQYDTEITERDENGGIKDSQTTETDGDDGSGTVPPPDPQMKRIVGVVKGKYRSDTSPRKDFDFKITVQGKARLLKGTALNLMEDTLRNCLSFAQANIKAMAKAQVTQAPTDDEAIDIQPQRGRQRPFKGKHEMLFKSGAWYGFGFPRKQIKFPASVSMERSLSKSEKTM